MSNTIKFKRGAKANLPILNQGEPAFTTDTNDLYVGNGTSNIKYAKDSDLHSVYTTTNSGNVYSVTIPNIIVLEDGHLFVIKFNAASTGSITLNINNLGAKSIVDYSGSAVTDVRANLIVNLRYESNAGNFILQGKGGGATQGAETLSSGIKMLTNLVSNGNFANGTTGFFNTSSSALTVSSNIGSFTPTVQWGSIYKNIATPSANDKVYISAKIYSDTAVQICYEYASGLAVGNITPTVANTWQTISSIGTMPSSGISYGKFICNDGRVSGWTTTQITNIVAINLTKTYGAGNEPTKAQMDTILTSFNGYFDGTIVINNMPSGSYTAKGSTGNTEILIPSAISNVGSEPVTNSAIALYNILDNGSFESTYNWSDGVLDTTYKKYGTYSMKMVSANTSDAKNIGQYIPIISGHKYYTSGWFLRTTSLTQQAQFDICDISPEMDTASLDNSSIPTTGAWYRLSSINTAPSTGRAKLRGYSFNTDPIYMDGFTLIDLTACFGSGYEPSKSQMDNLMTSIGGWFTGTLLVNKISPGIYTTTGTSGTTEVLTGRGEYINRQLAGDDFMNSTYPTLRFSKGSAVQYGSYGTASAANRLAICPPQGYYPGGGSGYVTAEASEVANAIGLTSDKLVSGNTICGVDGSIPDRGIYQYSGGVGSSYDSNVNSNYLAFNNIPEGYYHKDGYSWAPEIRAKFIDVANFIGLTPDKLLSGNTILDVVGNASSGKTAILTNFSISIPAAHSSSGGTTAGTQNVELGFKPDFIFAYSYDGGYSGTNDGFILYNVSSGTRSHCTTDNTQANITNTGFYFLNWNTSYSFNWSGITIIAVKYN